MERYVKRYGEPPSAMIGAMTIYDAVLAIVHGIMAVGPDAAKVRDFLRIYKTLGALGSISFDERGEVQGVEYPLSELQADGTSKLLRK